VILVTVIVLTLIGGLMIVLLSVSFGSPVAGSRASVGLAATVG
jgi:hypothetical protein